MNTSAVASRRVGRPKSPEKRRAIRRAGSDLFLARGVDAVSMDEVAAAAGVSKQTVYSHFGSKEELFQACIHDKLAQHRLALEDLPTAVEPLGALRVMAERFLELIGDPEVIAMHRAVIAKSVHHQEVARLFYEAGPRETVRAVRHLIAAAVDGGELEVDELDEAAELFLSMLKGLSDLRCMVGVAPPIPPTERPARAARVVEHMRAIYRPGR